MPSECKDCVFYHPLKNKGAVEEVEKPGKNCYKGHDTEKESGCLDYNPPLEHADDDFPGVE